MWLEYGPRDVLPSREYLSKENDEGLSFVLPGEKAPTQVGQHKDPQAEKWLVCLKKEVRDGGMARGNRPDQEGRLRNKARARCCRGCRSFKQLAAWSPDVSFARTPGYMFRKLRPRDRDMCLQK